MKLMLGKPDDTELVLAEQTGGSWRPNTGVIRRSPILRSNPDQWPNRGS
jgi:hypothetical protein